MDPLLWFLLVVVGAFFGVAFLPVIIPLIALVFAYALPIVLALWLFFTFIN